MKIALIENQSIGVNIHRLLTPYSHLQPHHDVIMTNGVLTTDYDIVVFNRLPNQCLTDLEKVKEKGEEKEAESGFHQAQGRQAFRQRSRVHLSNEEVDRIRRDNRNCCLAGLAGDG